jgi:hypothetical protein
MAVMRAWIGARHAEQVRSVFTALTADYPFFNYHGDT